MQHACCVGRAAMWGSPHSSVGACGDGGQATRGRCRSAERLARRALADDHLRQKARSLLARAGAIRIMKQALASLPGQVRP